MEKLDGQGLKVHIANNGTPSVACREGLNITYRMLPPQTFNLNLTMRKQSCKSKLMHGLQKLT